MTGVQTNLDRSLMRTLRQLEFKRQQDALSRHLRARPSLEELRKLNIYRGG